tara:strand:+ start:4563 stop:5483 length:921 start_codon:yes stop_codon:yes gene_type:complete
MESIHIETTNRCTLECPACPRTTWKQMLGSNLPKQDLDLDELEYFLDCDEGRKIEKFKLCGDYGDTLYYPKLFELIKRFRDRTFKIQTNGSYRNKEWWEELNSLLTDRDEIIFAIDGTQETNHLYRKNADWKSTMIGLDVMSKGPAKTRWQTIIFSFNQNNINDIKQIAESKGAEFFTLRTHRFGKEELRPTDSKLTEEEYMYKQEFNNKDSIDIIPQCHVMKTVTAGGVFMPCDWIRNPRTFYISELWKERTKWIDKLRIKDVKLDEANIIIEQWVQNVIEKGKLGTAEVLCKMKCRNLECLEKN